MNRPKRLRPTSRPVLHDIRIAKVQRPDGREKLVAQIDCERRGCTLDVEVCRSCERFVRIDSHEAGFVMLCRSADESLDGED